LYKPEITASKKKRKTLKKSQSSKESEEDEDLEDEEDDEEEDKQKQKKQKTGHESYLEYLDMGNFKNTPSKKKRTKLLADDDDDDLIELSPGTMKLEKMDNPTISPVTVKMGKMGKEMVVHKKEQKQTLEDMEKRIKQEMGVQIGEFFKIYLDKKMPAEQPEQGKKDEDEKHKHKN